MQHNVKEIRWLEVTMADRVKMSRSDRAKQFAPFDALKGLQETIKIKEYTDEFATPYKAAERGYVDDVIEHIVHFIQIGICRIELTDFKQTEKYVDFAPFAFVS